MKTKLSKTEARTKIDDFFKQETLDKEKLRKIRRLAMKFKIPLKEKRKRFCKKCKSQLNGSVRITKTHKTIICKECSFRNKFKLN